MCDSSTGFCTQLPLVSPSYTLNEKCSGIVCPAGNRCDSNTGKCAAFRTPVDSVTIVDKCEGFSCPSGYFCDSSSGACRLSMVLYPTGRSTTIDRCSRVICPSGHKCDNNTGICRIFRNSGETRSLCASVTCPNDQFCDSNTGKCRSFRITNFNEDEMSLCANVKCASGEACDSNTGECRSFAITARSTKCNKCPTGTECDENTGNCRTFRQPLRFAKLLEKMVDSCKNILCERGHYCRDGECHAYEARVSSDTLDTTLASNSLTTSTLSKEEEMRNVRDLIAAELLRILQAEDRCSEMKCEDGKMCDRQTGTCERCESSISSLFYA